MVEIRRSSLREQIEEMKLKRLVERKRASCRSSTPACKSFQKTRYSECQKYPDKTFSPDTVSNRGDKVSLFNLERRSIGSQLTSDPTISDSYSGRSNIRPTKPPSRNGSIGGKTKCERIINKEKEKLVLQEFLNKYQGSEYVCTFSSIYLCINIEN